ncbi:MAG: GNAT family N-acetyltransferase [Ascidiaceihabitans sp.]|nr:GNAT family N-acetyltransferase [Ascidiaceihabitans sp.]
MIRTANASDASAITALWNNIIEDTSITFTTIPKTEDEIRQIIADTARLVHVAQHNGAFAGFALVGPFRGGPGYAHTVEHTVYLHTSAQGNGLGSHLMHALMSAAIVAGHHVMVGAISGTNSSAIAFHKTIDFQNVGVIEQAGRKNGDWHDLVLMQKILQNAH